MLVAEWKSPNCDRIQHDRPVIYTHTPKTPSSFLLPSFLFLLDRVPKLLGSFCFSLQCRYPLTQQHNCVCASTHFFSPFFLFTSPVIHRSDQANGGGDSAAARRRNARRSQFPPLLFYFTFLFIFFFVLCDTADNLVNLVTNFSFHFPVKFLFERRKIL